MTRKRTTKGTTVEDRAAEFEPRIFETKTLDLPVALTELEVAASAAEAAELAAQLAKVIEAKKAAAKASAAAIDELSMKRDSLLDEVRTRTRIGQVEVEAVLSAATRLVHWTRTDNGEILRSRAATDEELQRSLFPSGVDDGD